MFHSNVSSNSSSTNPQHYKHTAENKYRFYLQTNTTFVSKQMLYLFTNKYLIYFHKILNLFTNKQWIYLLQTNIEFIMKQIVDLFRNKYGMYLQINEVYLKTNIEFIYK